MEQNKISLIICTYNRPNDVRNLLLALLGLARKPDEVIVVDASTSNETKIIVEQLNEVAQLKIIYELVSFENRGLTKQRNLGISLATGNLVSFLDDDTIPFFDYFTAIENVFNQKSDAVGVGGHVITDSEWIPFNQKEIKTIHWYYFDGFKRQDSKRWVLRKRLGLSTGDSPGHMPKFGHGRPANYPNIGKIYEVEYFMGCASTWRKELFSKAQYSLFFEGYGLYEDMDFCISANFIGKNYYCPAARVNHYHSPNARPRYFHYGKMVTYNGWYVWRRRWKSPAIIDIAKWWLITILLLTLRFFDIRNGGPEEAIGRIAGCFKIIFSPPKIP